jgi:hypothetical protein
MLLFSGRSHADLLEEFVLTQQDGEYLFQFDKLGDIIFTKNNLGLFESSVSPSLFSKIVMMMIIMY